MVQQLSKGTSDIKNGTQEKIPIYGFFMPLHVVRFVLLLVLAPKPLFLNGKNSSTANDKLLLCVRLGFHVCVYRGRAEQTTPRKGVSTPDPERGFFSCVPFCLRSILALDKM